MVILKPGTSLQNEWRNNTAKEMSEGNGPQPIRSLIQNSTMQ